MASPFEITAVTNTIALDNKRQGLATFTVRNLTRRRVRAVGKLLTTPPDSPALAWIGIVPVDPDGEPSTTDVRDIGIDATQQYQVEVTAPVNATPGPYAFRLVVADEINPDENYTRSPDVTFTVPPPPVEEKKALPGWLIPLIVAVVLVVGGIVALLVARNNQQADEANQTSTAVEEARLTADALTNAALTPTSTSTSPPTATPTRTNTPPPTATNTRRPPPTATRFFPPTPFFPCNNFPNLIPNCDDIQVP